MQDKLDVPGDACRTQTVYSDCLTPYSHFFCSLIAKGEPRCAGRDLHAKESMQRFQTKQSWETLRIPLRNSRAKCMQVCVCVCRKGGRGCGFRGQAPVWDTCSVECWERTKQMGAPHCCVGHRQQSSYTHTHTLTHPPLTRLQAQKRGGHPA